MIYDVFSTLQNTTYQSKKNKAYNKKALGDGQGGE